VDTEMKLEVLVKEGNLLTHNYNLFKGIPFNMELVI
jgi:hypothetical protein